MPAVPSKPTEAAPKPAAPRVRAPLVRVPANSVSFAREAEGARWVTATALTWVNVRVDPRRDAGIAGIIPPDMRVELGESRAGWTRVRASRISGWVGHRMFATDSTGHPH